LIINHEILRVLAIGKSIFRGAQKFAHETGDNDFWMLVTVIQPDDAGNCIA
jgi:hypothetical protein